MNSERADFDIDVPVDHNFHQQANAKVLRWEATLPQKYWDYRQRWENDPKNRVLSKVPIHLDIEATSACNLRCIMCPRTDMIESGTFWKVQNFDLSLYRQLIDEGVEKGLCSLKFNYLGEPLMNPDLIEMIRYAKQAGVIDVMFNTNAALLTEEKSRQLIASGLDKLFFSFDSPRREDYNRIRIGADYDKVFENIKRFMAIRQEMNSIHPFTRVSMVLMKETEGVWEDFQAMFSPVVDAVAYVDYLDHAGQHNPERTLVPLGSRKSRFCCPQLWQRMFVHPDGVVTPCCIDSARDLEMGNVKQQSIEEIWLGERYQSLRELHAAGRFEESATCARCPLARY
jgi:radical SAM protein with 4Fe4S-binding SPASM domain